MIRISTAREIFRAARDAAVALRDLDRQRRQYESMINASGMRFSAAAMTRDNHSRVEDVAIKIADLEADLQVEAVVYLEAIMEARRLIARVDPTHQRILTLRYLCGMHWTEISDELHYKDPKSVFRAHGWALKAADDVMKKR